MKRLLICCAALICATTLFAQKNLVSTHGHPGVRWEIVTTDFNESQYQLFSFEDKDGTFGYYLSLGPASAIPGTFIVFDQIRETCLYMGTTLDEVKENLQSLIEFFNYEAGTTREFPARIGIVNTLQTEQRPAVAVVQKRLFGKRLVFTQENEKYSTQTYLRKGAVKSVLTSLKIFMKMHPNAQ